MDRVDTRKWSEAYGVTQRTVQRWVNARQPVEYPAEMAKVILADPRSSAVSRTKAIGILNPGASPPHSAPLPQPFREDRSRGAPPPPPDVGYVDPDWKAFTQTGEESIESADTVAGLKRLRAFNVKKLEVATSMNDAGGIATYTKQVIDLENAINRNLLMAKKLGVDAGELMKRETVERFLEAFAFLLMRGADDAIDELARSCAGKAFPEEIRPLIEDYLISTRMLRPFRAVVGQRSEIGLPTWFVEKLVNVATDNIEGARAELPQPAPPAAPSPPPPPLPPDSPTAPASAPLPEGLAHV